MTDSFGRTITVTDNGDGTSTYSITQADSTVIKFVSPRGMTQDLSMVTPWGLYQMLGAIYGLT